MKEFYDNDRGERKFMIAVLSKQIQDYLNSKAVKRHENAREYIFDDTWDSENYVFGFKFVSRYLGLDPERLRKRIAEMKEKTRGIRNFNVKRLIK